MLNFPDTLTGSFFPLPAFRAETPAWRNTSGMVHIHGADTFPPVAYYGDVALAGAQFSAYKIYVWGIRASSDDAWFRFAISTDNLATTVNSNYAYQGIYAKRGGAPTRFGSEVYGADAVTLIPNAWWATYSGKCFLELTIWHDPGYMITFNWVIGYMDAPATGGFASIAMGGGWWPSGGIVTHLRFYHWNGSKTLNGGSYEIFGIK